MSFLYELWKRKWLFAAIATGVLVAALPTPEGLSRSGQTILAIAAGSVVIFVTEAVPLPTVALLIAILQVVFLGMDSTAVARTYMNDSVFFIMGSLMLAVAFVKQRLDRRLAYFLLKVTKGSVDGFAFSILAVSAGLAALIGEHTVAAILLPVCLVVLRTVQEREGTDKALTALLLFSLAYGCTIAGAGTPSGGARNAILIEYFDSMLGIHFGYLEWIVIAFPILLLLVPAIWLIIRKLNPPHTKSLSRVLEKLKTEVHQSGDLGTKDWLTIGIFLLTLALWLTMSSAWGLGIVALTGAALCLATGCVEWHDLNMGVNWGAVLLFASAMSVGSAMIETRAANWLAVNFLGMMNAIGLGSGIALIIAIALMVTAVNNVMSSGAAVAIMAPVTIEIALRSGVNPVLMGFVTVIAAAFGFLTVGGHPALTIVYSAGYLPAREFLRMGWKITLVSVVILVLYALTWLALVA